MQFSIIYPVIIQKLRLELSANLSYHNVSHTEKVIEAAKQLSDDEELNDEDKTLVSTAALFHDSGFLNGSVDHEEKSCEIARHYLPAYDYSPGQIDEICRLILATRNPQKPTNLLENILCDADLSHLGTDTFATVSANLYKELKHVNNVSEIERWPEYQMQFLREHKYHTSSAEKRFGSIKEKNIANLVKNYKPVQATLNQSSSDFFIQDFVFILAGVITAGFALKGFLIPNKFFDGGITGDPELGLQGF